MARIFKTGITAEGTVTANIIDASSVSTTTADIFGNVTTGIVGIADGLTTGTLNIGNGTTSSTGRTVNINTNASGSVTVTTNIGSSVLGGTINLIAGYPGVILSGTPLITTPATTGSSSSNLSISTGATTTSGSSGTIVVDVGTSAGTAGAVYLGTSNSSEVRVGRVGITTNLKGTVNYDSTTTPIHLNASAGTTGQVLTSAGTGATPTWTTPGLTSWTAFQSGYYYYAQGGTQTNATPTLNTMTLVPFALSVSTTFTKIGIYVNTGGAAGAVVRLGIYNSSNGLPGTRLLDAGTVATTTSSALALITISQTLAPGLYWLAAVPQTTTCSAQCKGAGHVPMVPFNGSPANSSARGLQVASVSGALPTPAGTLAMSSTPFEVFLQL